MSDNYEELERVIEDQVSKLDETLYTTNARNLFGIFLAGIHPSRRKIYNCRCCQKFIEKYFSLVTISDLEISTPALLNVNRIPELFQDSFKAMYLEVRRSRVTGVFYWDEMIWGSLQTKHWTHLHGVPNKVFKDPEKLMAEKAHDFQTLKIAVSTYTRNTIQTALGLLNSGALDRSEKAIGVAEFFYKVKNNPGHNMLWKAVAEAPAGFCHIKSTILGALLDDVKNGLPLKTIQERWNARMNPLQYQRPTVLKEGTIQVANKLVKELESVGAFKRRFATLEDVTHYFWKAKDSGIFDHLRQQGIPTNKLMTWEKFQRKVLPEARSIELLVPMHSTFAALVTGPKEPLLFQWNNPVSWYQYVQGSSASNWNLESDSWVKVPMITCLPCHWTSGSPNHEEGVFLILDGARDKGHKRGGAWFPECLKSEYHPIRAAMEAYANNLRIDGEASACGLLLSKSLSWNASLRINKGKIITLDRWD